MPDKTITLHAMVHVLDRLMTRIEGEAVPGAHRHDKRVRIPRPGVRLIGNSSAATARAPLVAGDPPR